MTLTDRPRGRKEALVQLRLALGELLGAERRLRGREQQEPQDLTHSQLRALALLENADQVTAGDLAKSADLNPASVTAMLDHLESRGIVERSRSLHDRRVCIVSLTPRGQDIVQEKRASFEAHWEEHFSDLSEEDLIAALPVMRKLTEVIDGF